MPATAGFDAYSLAAKLRHTAAEFREGRRYDLAAEHFARRLEAHADAMLRPETALRERFFTLREKRLAGLGGR